ncbi:MAG: DUF4031 domain-containing protein [Ilumatobacteraceae bacterium]
MAVLIDPPVWWHRERRWSHLVSDADFGELHRFAADAGIPERGFHGDHYDVPEEWYADMVARGAVPVTSRELLHRLWAAGLRMTPAQRRAGGVPSEPLSSGSALGGAVSDSTTS